MLILYDYKKLKVKAEKYLINPSLSAKIAKKDYVLRQSYKVI